MPLTLQQYTIGRSALLDQPHSVMALARLQNLFHSRRKNRPPFEWSPDQICRRFSLSEIKSATKNFDDTLLVGRGASATVYRGTLRDGTTVAVKRWNSVSGGGLETFRSEIVVLSQFRHRYVVSLIGYCDDRELALVQEYVPRGTLARHLHGGGNPDSLLPWARRLKICVNAARGLDYLHNGARCPIIHRDVKSSNILLDDNYEARVSDFGLSVIDQIVSIEDNASSRAMLRGTVGYLDPEYFLTNRATTKSDVYAFGVVLFEVLCGRPAVDSGVNEDEKRSLARWAVNSISEGTDQIVDPKIKGQISPDCLWEFVQIAEQCLRLQARERPSMAEVVVKLELILALQEQEVVEASYGGHHDELIDQISHIEDVDSPTQQDVVNAGSGSNDTSKAYDEQENIDSSKEQDAGDPGYCGHDQEQIGGISNTSEACREQFLKQVVINVGTSGHHEEQVDDNLQLGDSCVVPQSIKFSRKMLLCFSSPVSFISGNGVKPLRNGKSNNNNGSSSLMLSGQVVTQSFRVFSFAELRRATGNFRPNMVLGKGGSGIVFKGWVHENTYAPSQVGVGMAVVVKKLNLNGHVRPKEAKVKFMGKYSHPNLVKLLGYCLEDEDFLLVSDYVQKGSLEHYLFNHDAKLLPWVIRLNIARGAVRGLAFLHRTKEQAMYRSFKASDILLDMDLNAKLSDFGLAKLSLTGSESIFSTLTMGDTGYIDFPQKDVGYVDPEYVASGHLTVKSDIYGFGAILLEILTGLRVLDMNRPDGMHDLVQYARPFLAGKGNLRSILDQRLKHDCLPEDEVLSAVAALALKCLEDYPKNRPGVKEVLETLEQIHAIQTKLMNATTSTQHPTSAFLDQTHSVMLAQLQNQFHSRRENQPPLEWSPDQICRRFSLSEIKSATKNFDNTLLIGGGRSAMVYRGTLGDGTTVAVKRWKSVSCRGLETFRSEIAVLSQIRHRHVVSLIGYCDDRELALVQEYMPRGTLARHLHGSGNPDSFLSWVRRLKICVNVARGLDYLHSGAGCPIVHRDVKSSNILLDDNYEAVVSDFGLSMICQIAGIENNVPSRAALEGTFGYLDPEYILTNIATTKSDVYAFGVVLFEVLCGRPAVDSEVDEEEKRSLARWALSSISEGTDQIVDPKIRGQISADRLCEFMQIAEQCLRVQAMERPTMAEVVAKLEFTLALQEQEVVETSYGGHHDELTDQISQLKGLESLTELGLVDAGSGSSDTSKAYAEQENISSSEERETGDPGYWGHDQEEFHDCRDNSEPFDELSLDLHFSAGRVDEGDLLLLPLSGLDFCGAARCLKFSWKELLSSCLFSLSSGNGVKSSKNGISNGSNGYNSRMSSGQVVAQNFRVFSFTELKRATGNFGSNMVLGKGDSGIVFKGWVHEKTYAPSQAGVGMAVAVKKLNLNGHVGPKEAKVKFMGKFSHPNLVKLLGYCLEDKDFLLVSEYVQKGSLEHHLFNHNADLLPWITRLNIARGAARGLSFLHRTKEQAMYRSFKASDILLDMDFNAKLSDFGLANSSPTGGPSVFSTLIEGDTGFIDFPRKDVGYVDPEYIATGYLTVKSDIYGFGATLLEILTGLRVLDMDRPNGELDLVRYVKRFLTGKRNLRSILDQRLEHDCRPKDEVLSAVVTLALKCLEDRPRNRPGVEEVLETLEQIHAIQTKSMNFTTIAQHPTLQSQA
ncbi:hypothetical protein RJ640_026779 [Escallonia rubra]|uniref:Protein kinase domain-containing protein n=1 Tax=Escallonia rubra TaxID=112253 RepID=A0AA88S371_9ASTE|nr:hypothetical protein RJ640_026779 [Escallonia rubra]